MCLKKVWEIPSKSCSQNSIDPRFELGIAKGHSFFFLPTSHNWITTYFLTTVQTSDEITIRFTSRPWKSFGQSDCSSTNISNFMCIHFFYVNSFFNRLSWEHSWWRICLQCRRPWFNSWVQKTPWRRDWVPTPHSWASLVAQLVKNPPAKKAKKKKNKNPPAIRET